MDFQLSIISYHRYTSQLDAIKPLDSIKENTAIYIGRSELCDWILPDPERVISSRHAVIEKKEGCLVIKDLSTNGLFINRGVEPLGKNNHHQLSLGDVFSLSDYEIEVQELNVNEPVPSECQMEIDKSNTDDYGISSKDLMNEPIEKETTISDVNNEVYIGDVNDNFTSPSNENIDLMQFNDSIPEDWSVLFNEGAAVETPPQKSPSSSPIFDEIEQQGVEVKHKYAEAATIEDAKKQAIRKEVNVSVVSQPSQSKVSPVETLNLAVKGDEAKLLQAFIEGMKVKGHQIHPEMDEKWWFEMGESMCLLLTGLMSTLQKRADFKQTNRLMHTSFKRQENNPLKFSANFEDAIHNLYHRKSPSFLSAPRAIQEAFADIDLHEKAMVYGTKGAVKGVMSALEPNKINSIESHEGVLASWFGSKHRANSWQRYESLFYELEDDLRQEQPFYLDDFVKHYEASLKGIGEK
ncbi:type VI secretion system-associated FHA domain protein TagH [Photobacterium swingsii]|uniref:type VI secretion system-associated FHA domain protein TagH n=1 Tax=Photobacterium swingsii TaxID=680026 RepID=UPI0040683803